MSRASPGPAGAHLATEFGQDRFDEINRISKGPNYGWPVVEGFGGDRKRYTPPLLTWTTAEASPSGLAYAGGSLWAGALGGRRLWQVPAAANGTVGMPVAHFEGRYGRPARGRRRPRRLPVGEHQQPRRPGRSTQGRRPDPGDPSLLSHAYRVGDEPL